MKVVKQKVKLTADPRRVLLMFFFPGNIKRATRIVEQIISYDENKARDLMEIIMAEFSSRHKNITGLFHSHFDKISGLIKIENGEEETALIRRLNSASVTEKLLIGAYFSKEYSVESAALFNPSIVHLLSGGEGGQNDRFIMSVRATGEGHISSVGFRSGRINTDGMLSFDSAERIVSAGDVIGHGAGDSYSVTFDDEIPLSARILFPQSEDESNGMEDVRFVRFNDEIKGPVYYGTYTAYDGKQIKVKLIETSDFTNFFISPLSGAAIADKGMALFPRKIDGKYTMISRQDGENLYIMRSNDLYRWEEKRLLRSPEFDWELIQMGNCGSPVETTEGWVLLTHGVGAVRKYVVSALLLELEEPAVVKGYLPQPLISAEGDEREGYVPNVVYTCGATLFNDTLIIPYAMSDSATGAAHIQIKDLIKGFVLHNSNMTQV